MYRLIMSPSSKFRSQHLRRYSISLDSLDILLVYTFFFRLMLSFVLTGLLKQFCFKCKWPHLYLFEGKWCCLSSTDLLDRHSLSVDGFNDNRLKLAKGIWPQEKCVIKSDEALQQCAWHHCSHTLGKQNYCCWRLGYSAIVVAQNYWYKILLWP